MLSLKNKMQKVSLTKADILHNHKSSKFNLHSQTNILVNVKQILLIFFKLNNITFNGSG